MSTTTVAAGAATTNWRTYDGVVPQSLRFYAIFFPVVMAAVIVLPTAICYFCLSRGRPVPYTPLNTPGGFDRKSPYNASVNHGSVAEK